MVNVRGGFLGSFRWRIGKWLRSLKLQTCKTTQENNCRIPCLVHGEHSGQPVTRYYCLENMYVRGK